MKYISILAGIAVAGMFIINEQRLENIEKLPLSKPTPTEQFMKKIARIESGGNHRVVNQFGMLGKYQFSPSTIRVLGFKVSDRKFLNDSRLQDSVMVAYMRANHRELRWYIKNYSGKTVHGVKVTRAGILAGAHFAGSFGVKQYLTNGAVISDGNGTTIRQYMAQFSNFHLPQLM
jgi:hypothetical protein